MHPRPLKLRLLNDYEIVVNGLAAMLEPFRDRVTVVAAEVDGVSDKPVDLTLYDTFGRTVPKAGSISKLAADPATGTLVVYTWDEGRGSVRKAWMKSGYACLDKSLAADELVAELERIANGALPSRAGEPEEARMSQPQTSWPGSEHGLSLREAETIALISQGHSNTEIAAALYLSENSLKSYIRAAYRKIGVERRAQAVRWGIEHGMLPDAELSGRDAT